MIVDLKEARRLAWETAAFASHVEDVMSIPDLERPKHEGLKIIANTLRDLCDEVERTTEAYGHVVRILQMLNVESLGDFIYDVRAQEMQGWDGPRVKNWGAACEAIRKLSIAPLELKETP